MSTTPHTPTAERGPDGLAIIGRTLHDLRGIRYEQGEGGNQPPAPAAPPAAPSSTPTPAPAAPAAPTPPPAAPSAPASTEQPPAVNPKTGQPYTAAETQAYIAELRNEAKTNREAREAAEAAIAAQNAALQAALVALGVQPDPSQPPADPAALQATIAERTQAAEQVARENVVLRVAGSRPVPANADALLDSRAFTSRLASIAVDDRAGVEALVDEFVTNDDRFRTTPAPAAASGGAAHSGATPSTARKPVHQAIAERIAAQGK